MCSKNTSINALNKECSNKVKLWTTSRQWHSCSTYLWRRDS